MRPHVYDGIIRYRTQGYYRRGCKCRNIGKDGDGGGEALTVAELQIPDQETGSMNMEENLIGDSSIIIKEIGELCGLIDGRRAERRAEDFAVFMLTFDTTDSLAKLGL
jgi:hypothetical protein